MAYWGAIVKGMEHTTPASAEPHVVVVNGDRAILDLFTDFLAPAGYRLTARWEPFGSPAHHAGFSERRVPRPRRVPAVEGS